MNLEVAFFGFAYTGKNFRAGPQRNTDYRPFLTLEADLLWEVTGKPSIPNGVVVYGEL